MNDYLYVFHCPVHGEETGVFCFRAYDKSFFPLWKIYKIERIEVIGRDLEDHKSVLWMQLREAGSQ